MTFSVYENKIITRVSNQNFSYDIFKRYIRSRKWFELNAIIELSHVPVKLYIRVKHYIRVKRYIRVKLYIRVKRYIRVIECSSYREYVFIMRQFDEHGVTIQQELL